MDSRHGDVRTSYLPGVQRRSRGSRFCSYRTHRSSPGAPHRLEPHGPGAANTGEVSDQQRAPPATSDFLSTRVIRAGRLPTAGRCDVPDSPDRAASPHTPHTGSSHPPPAHSTHQQTGGDGRAHLGSPDPPTSSHLVIRVWVRPTARAIKSKEVLAVFIQIVDAVFVLKQSHVPHTHTHTHSCRNGANILSETSAHTHGEEFTLQLGKFPVSTVAAKIPAESTKEEEQVRAASTLKQSACVRASYWYFSFILLRNRSLL